MDLYPGEKAHGTGSGRYEIAGKKTKKKGLGQRQKKVLNRYT